LEAAPLLGRGVALRSNYRKKCEAVVSAYDGRLRGLKFIALLRPRLMIYTGLWLLVVIIWFILIIFSFYYPQSKVSPYIIPTYRWAVWISLVTVVLGILIGGATFLSFSRIYDFLKHRLPQPQQRLASRIDRDDDGFFYIDQGEAERIIATVIRNVLNNPEWYSHAIVFKPSGDEMKSAKYANLLFFGQLVEGRATLGSGLDRWNWVTELYRTTDFFEPARLKELTATKKFGESVITKLKEISEHAELSIPTLNDALNDGVTRLGRRFNYDARNIGNIGFWNGLLVSKKLRTRYEVLKTRLRKLEVLDEPPAQANIVQLIKLMATRNIWQIEWQDVEFAFAPWQCVFLLRSGILKTDLPNFSAWDKDFEWFRDDALKKISNLVQRSLQLLSDKEKTKIKTILNSDIDFPGTMVLADTFLWMVGTQCCRYNNCGQMTGNKGKLCPLGQFAICTPAPGKKMFTYKQNNFVLE
jgi:hypothetical protein